MTDKQLADAFAAHRRAEKALDAKRVELFKAIGEAVTSGRVRQGEVVEQLGFTREHIRRICHSYVEWQEGRNPEFKMLRSDRPAQRSA